MRQKYKTVVFYIRIKKKTSYFIHTNRLSYNHLIQLLFIKNRSNLKLDLTQATAIDGENRNQYIIYKQVVYEYISNSEFYKYRDTLRFL